MKKIEYGSRNPGVRMGKSARLEASIHGRPEAHHHGSQARSPYQMRSAECGMRKYTWFSARARKTAPEAGAIPNANRENGF